MLKRFFALTMLLSMGLFGSSVLVGCGQKGPLYMPADIPEEVSSQASADQQAKDAKPETATTD